MKPAFALLFSADGVVLMHRVAQGWVVMGRALMADDDFAQRLANLRRMADDLDAGGGVKLVLPNDQILYTNVDAPGPGRQKQRSQIKSALIGRTPYEVQDLAFDWVGAGPTVQVAVIARETLSEAETFALEHGFEPISFVARPDPAEFTGEPFFGVTSALPKGTRIPRDDAPVPDPDAPPGDGGADSLSTPPPVAEPLAGAQLDLLDFAAKSEPKSELQQPISELQRPAQDGLSAPLGPDAPAKEAPYDALPTQGDVAPKIEVARDQRAEARVSQAEPVDMAPAGDAEFAPEPEPEPELSAASVPEPPANEIRDAATLSPVPSAPIPPSTLPPAREAPAAFDVPVQDTPPDLALDRAAPAAIDAALPDYSLQPSAVPVAPVSVISPSLPDIEPAALPPSSAQPRPIADPRAKVGRLGRAAVGAVGGVARAAVAPGLPKSENRSVDPRPVLAARVRDSGSPIVSPFQNPPPAPVLARPAALAAMGAVFLAVLALVLWWVFSDPVPEVVQEPVSSLGAESGAFAEGPAVSPDPVSDPIPEPASEVVVQATPTDDGAAEGVPQSTDLVGAALPDAGNAVVEPVAEGEATAESPAQPLPDAVDQAIAASLQDGNGADVGVADMGEGGGIPAPLPRPTRAGPQSFNADPQIEESQRADGQVTQDVPTARVADLQTETTSAAPAEAEPQIGIAAPGLDDMADRVAQITPADGTTAAQPTDDLVLSDDQPMVQDVPVLAAANRTVTVQPVPNLRPADPIPQLMPPPLRWCDWRQMPPPRHRLRRPPLGRRLHVTHGGLFLPPQMAL